MRDNGCNARHIRGRSKRQLKATLLDFSTTTPVWDHKIPHTLLDFSTATPVWDHKIPHTLLDFFTATSVWDHKIPHTLLDFSTATSVWDHKIPHTLLDFSKATSVWDHKIPQTTRLRLPLFIPIKGHLITAGLMPVSVSRLHNAQETAKLAVRAATLKHKWQIKTAISSSHGILTPDQPVQTLTLQCGRAASREPLCQ